MYALIQNGKVKNVIVADAEFVRTHGERVAGVMGGGSWVELTRAHEVKGQRPGPGWLYNAATNKFSRPAGGA